MTALHNKNNNGKPIATPRIPSEGFGVSNDARELLSPPYSDKAWFELGSEARTISVEIE